MNKTVTALTLAAVTATAAADFESQSFTYNWADPAPIPAFTFDRFDTQGGTRELTGVTLRLDADISFDLLIENNNMYGVNAGDFYVDAYSNVLMAFNDETPGSANLFFGLGGIGATSLTADLAASDGGGLGGLGGSGNGTGPDTAAFSFADSISSVLQVDNAYLGEFLLDGQLHGIIGPYNDITSTDFNISGSFNANSQAGTLKLIYLYNNVPTPGAGLALLGSLGLATRRRRA